MGVPSFYRWLVGKYPKIVANAIDRKGERIDSNVPEFDNLYLDMNGIIHPCFHPEDEDHVSPPTTFQEVFQNIYEYIDCLFAIVRPQKLLFLAIDGVAPRAKMNQQRSRRFRTSKDNEIEEAEERRLRRQFEIEGKPLVPKQESEISDSNIITPGTVFMHELSKSMQSYIGQRILNNAAWKNIKVILSDANVPGEGEHKIMMFIRLQRASPGYNPNTRHCLYGLDADLIMLALATHEVHFSILREDVLVQLPVDATHSKVQPSSYEQNHEARGNADLVKKPYQFLHVWLLREYLELDMDIVDPPDNVAIDLERLIDDFIFVCFFAGNDFLPHMPTLELHEGGMDLLMHVYKHEFKNLGGYLVDMQRVGEKKASYVKLKRVEKFIQSVGTYEDRIFKKRTEIRERRLRRFLAECTNNVEEEQEEDCPSASADGKDYTSRSFESAKTEDSQSLNASYLSDALQNTKDLKQKLKTYLRDRSDLFKNGSFPPEKVKLGTVGWKDRYYKEKFGAETREDMEQTRKEVVHKYTEGLCWVLLYYFSGVPSWTWFYPFHYGPFASDLRGLSQVNVNFQKGSQFRPFDQLMAVLPPRSGHALPSAYQALMNSEKSDLIDFYPSDFEVDEEGKRYMWQAVCKLPFIVEERLLSCTKDLERELLDYEVERNSIKADILYVNIKQKLGAQIHSLYEKLREEKQTELFKQPIDTDLSCGMSGFISPLKEFLTYFAESNPQEYCEECQENKILCAAYELPNGSQHIPRPLEGINFPDKTIREDDIVETQLWHEFHGNMPSRTRPQFSNKNAIDGENPGSTKSYAGEMHKWAGSGWGCRRGVLANKSSDAYVHTKCAYGGHGGKLTVSSSSSWGETRGQNLSRGLHVHNAYRGAYNSAEKWTSSTSGLSESRGVENLRISDSRGFVCPGRAQPGMSTNFRSSLESDWNCGWRQNAQAPAAPPRQQGDRWSGHSGQHGEMRSRGSAASTPNAWQHNKYRDSRAFNCRGRGQPGISTSNQYQLLNSFENDGNFERRQTVQASEAPSVQHQDRWSGHSGQHRDSWSPNSAASTTNAWSHNQRGRYVPKANPTDWKLKGTMEKLA